VFTAHPGVYVHREYMCTRSICAREASRVGVTGVEKEGTVVLAFCGKELGVSIILPNEGLTTVEISPNESTSHMHVGL
jgi:hypothetical protein